MNCLRKRGAFTITEILIVVAIIGMLVALAIPNFMKTRAYAQMNVCIENLRQIESAKQIYALEHKKKNGDGVSVADLVGVTLYIKAMPECPSGGAYDFKVVGTNAECEFGPTLGHQLN